MTTMFAAIAFDPTIRGILVCVVAVAVLIGSLYLIISTNVGFRQGFLIAAAGLFGWCFLMGTVWWLYGIGFKGRDPAWHGLEVNYSRSVEFAEPVANSLPAESKLPQPMALLDEFPKVKAEAVKDPAFKDIVDKNADEHRLTLTKVVTASGSIQEALNEDLGGWRILPESDSRRGETVAAADAVLTSTKGKAATGFTAASDYFVEDVFYYGGKEASEPPIPGSDDSIWQKAWRRIESVIEVKNPPMYAAVTLQKAAVFPSDPSTAPPPPQPDPSGSVMTVIMERDLGNRRMIPAVFTLICGALFVVFASLLHVRDKELMAAKANAGKK